LDKFY